MIVIVTVYKSANYGSYLQAYTLYKALKEYGDVRFLDEGQRSYAGMSDVRDCISAIVRRLDFKHAYRKVKKLLANRRNWSKLPSITRQELANRTDTVFVLGSDEIWNVTKKKNRLPLFWGSGLKGVIMSYAPSVNMANAQQLEDFGAKKYLAAMSAISVRDEYSLQALSGLSESPIHKAVDPTLLFDTEDYLKEETYQKLPFRYIALYMFTGNKKDVYEENIRKFAAEKNLKIVSIGPQVHWADINIPSSKAGRVPFLYYLDADYVFTNTFHGTAFAINFNANFVCYARTNKIKDLLNSFNLEARDISGKMYSAILDTFCQEIDYEQVMLRKKELQASSRQLIQQFTCSINERV